MISYLSSHTAFHEFPHARTVFRDHLIGTFSILAAWDQPADVTRTGLFHTVYSGDIFQFFFLDAGNVADRAELRGVVGSTAEHLIYLFGTANRSAMHEMLERQGNTLSDAGVDVNGRLEVKGNDTMHLTPQEVAKIFVVTAADYLDQMVEVNGWRDHHQVDRPTRLYPGDMRPALMIHELSAMCHAVRDYFDTVPPAFDRCMTVQSSSDEERARDAYWRVVLDEDAMSWETQVQDLNEAAEALPFVGEPHVLLSELYFRRGDFAQAAVEAARALDRFFTLAAAWDKRLPFKAWVAYARTMLLRANRRRARLPSLPLRQPSHSEGRHVTSNGLALVPLRELVAQL